jgi:hypothetical protein
MIFHRDLQEVMDIPEIEKTQVKIRIDVICALDAARLGQTTLKTACIVATTRGRFKS